MIEIIWDLLFSFYFFCLQFPSLTMHIAQNLYRMHSYVMEILFSFFVWQANRCFVYILFLKKKLFPLPSSLNDERFYVHEFVCNFNERKKRFFSCHVYFLFCHLFFSRRVVRYEREIDKFVYDFHCVYNMCQRIRKIKCDHFSFLNTTTTKNNKSNTKYTKQQKLLCAIYYMYKFSF